MSLAFFTYQLLHSPPLCLSSFLIFFYYQHLLVSSGYNYKRPFEDLEFYHGSGAQLMVSVYNRRLLVSNFVIMDLKNKNMQAHRSYCTFTTYKF